MKKKLLHLTVNEEYHELHINPKKLLVEILRDELGLTGTKRGCSTGSCGACTVLVNKEAVRSCQFPLKDVKGKEVLTIEGLAKNGDLHPLQKAFIDRDALQCGFCTPGMILNAYSLLLKNPRPSRREILQEMEENLCRCGSYQRIVEAIQTAAKEMKGRK